MLYRAKMIYLGEPTVETLMDEMLADESTQTTMTDATSLKYECHQFSRILTLIHQKERLPVSVPELT